MQFLVQITQSSISELKVMQKENPRWEGPLIKRTITLRILIIKIMRECFLNHWNLFQEKEAYY